jgi:hypothetical protein
MENRIDQFVDAVYSDLGESKEIHDLREEMRNHLLQSARDLKAQGYSEEESVRLAIERFGDVVNLKRGLHSLYGSITSSTDSPRFGNVLAWIPLIVGALSLLISAYAPLSIPLGIIGLILGFITRKASNRHIAAWGMIVSAASILWTVFLLSLLTVHHSSVSPVKVDSSSQPIHSNGT